MTLLTKVNKATKTQGSQAFSIPMNDVSAQTLSPVRCMFSIVLSALMPLIFQSENSAWSQALR